MTMKKLFALLLCLAMVLGLAACGGGTAPTPSEAPKEEAEPTEAPEEEAEEPEPTEAPEEEAEPTEEPKEEEPEPTEEPKEEEPEPTEEPEEEAEATEEPETAEEPKDEEPETAEAAEEPKDEEPEAAEEPEVAAEPVEIRWWVPPTFIQDPDDPAGTYEEKLAEAFHEEYPNITVKVETIDFTTASDKITGAIESGTAADVLFDAPGRIIEYGKNGKLVPLDDMFTEEFIADVGNDALLTSCQGDGVYYMFPISASPFYMAINEDMWEDAGAMEYVNLEGDRSWTTEDFEKALEALYDKGYNPGVLFCNGQGGDQGTRALIANLYSGSVADLEKYTFDSPEMIKGLEKAQEWIEKGWLGNGVEYNGGQSIELFVAGQTSFELCWGTSAAGNNAATMEENGVKPISLPFPSDDGKAELEYLVNGFCVFDNGDEAKAAAAKQFIQWLCDSEENVVRTGAFPVKQSMGNLYPDDAEKELLLEFTKMYGPYYNTMDGFANMRAQWFDMLQRITDGGDVTELATAATEASNKELNIDPAAVAAPGPAEMPEAEEEEEKLEEEVEEEVQEEVEELEEEIDELAEDAGEALGTAAIGAMEDAVEGEDAEEPETAEEPKDEEPETAEAAEEPKDEEPEAAEEPEVAAEPVEIRWWVPPTFIQDPDDPAGTYEEKLAEAFHEEYPNITVKVETIDFTTASDKITGAIESGTAADVLFDAPGRIIEYGKNGKLVPLDDMFTEEFIADVGNDALLTSCQGDGVYYMFPISASPFYMAINEDMWEDAGAMEYVNLEGDRSWTTEDFEKALEALYDKGYNPGVLFCNGQGGDQGTRALIANLYSGSVADLEKYTFDSPEMIKGLEKAQEWIEKGWLGNGVEYNGGQSIEHFVAGQTSFELCWGTSAAGNNAATMEENGVKPISLPFPSDDGKAELEYLVNGFCVFDNGDEAKAAAAKQFIQWLCDSEENVVRTGAFPVKQSMGNLYPDDAEKELLLEFTKMYGPYYNTMDGFANMRAQWFDMLQRITDGGDVTELATAATEASNKGMAG